MFMICDLETTGRNPLSAEVLTGSFLAVNEAMQIVDEMHIMCKPEVWGAEAEAASNIHGITQEMVKDCPSFNQVKTELLHWFGYFPFKHFVCHAKQIGFGKKVTFDHAVLRLNLFPSEDYYTFGKIFRESEIISTHSLALHHESKYNFEKRDLKTVCRTLGVELGNHHDAKSDALACYEIFKILYPQTDLGQFFGGNYDDTDADNQPPKRKSNKSRKPKRSF
jgi:DNA polymerase III epsilon subunit-like protein